MKSKRVIALVLAFALVMALLGTSAFAADEESAEAASSSGLTAFDSTAWLYNETNDVYYQTGVVYCADPYDTTYESFGVYVPAAYMNMESNGDGTYTFVSFTDTEVNGYTAETAPIVMPVNTAGYAAQAAPTGYSSGTSTYTSAGIIYLYAGCRGRDTSNGGAPWGATDLKAAIRYYRTYSDVLPGNTDAIFTFGHSGGGAQSAVMGASGDSELYYPYLYSIGAAGIEYDKETDTYTSTVSDAIAGAMCWCPITSLDIADEAYEWMMGQYDTSDSTRSSGTWTSLLSDDMSEAYAEFINSLTLIDEDGNSLTLTETEDGIYTAGSYYDYILYQIEYSLNDFIDSYTDEDGNFSYSSSSSDSSTPGGDTPGDIPDGDSSGGPSTDDSDGPPDLPSSIQTASEDEVSAAALDSSESDELLEYLLSIDENYGTDDAWITYDSETGWYSVRSIEDFVLYGSKSASKSVGAFDDLSFSQAENAVFGAGSTESAHFDSIMADLLAANYQLYAAADDSVSESDVLAYAESYADYVENYTDSLGYSIEYRTNMYNPMYYVCEDYDGYGTSTIASFWRINTGITQSDTSLTTETNLYLALQEAVSKGDVESVDFAMYWEQGHTTAERAGADSDTCFIEWVEECVAALAADSGDDDTTEEESEDSGETESEEETTEAATEEETSGSSGESDSETPPEIPTEESGEQETEEETTTSSPSTEEETTTASPSTDEEETTTASPSTDEEETTTSSSSTDEEETTTSSSSTEEETTTSSPSTEEETTTEGSDTADGETSDSASVTVASGEALVLTVSGNYKELTVSIDGAEVDSSYITLSYDDDGNTIVTVSAEYVENLTAGTTYTVVVSDADGTVVSTAAVYVSEDTTAATTSASTEEEETTTTSSSSSDSGDTATGDSSNLAAWTCLAALAILVLAYAVISRRKFN